MTPPPLPGQPGTDTLRLATTANVLLPGAGLFILGRRKAGAIYAGLFLLCFLIVLVLFLVGYANYLTTAMDPDLLQGNKLEQIGQGFHKEWLMALAGFGVVIYALSTVQFSRVKGGFAKSES